MIICLLLSAGRRTALATYLREALHLAGGQLVTADCSPYAPALYIGDKQFLVPPIASDEYITAVLDLCRRQGIVGVLSLTDPELTLLSTHESEFRAEGVKLFHPPAWACALSLDKLEMARFLAREGFLAAETQTLVESTRDRAAPSIEAFPLVVKPRFGSASLGITIVKTEQELENLRQSLQQEELICQRYLQGEEYGVDCYVDYFTGQLVSLFAKRKIHMRSGETDKSVSFKDPQLTAIVQRLVETLGVRGAADVDAFLVGGAWYISEVNPRFGGGYPHAHELGCDFAALLVNNLKDQHNEPLSQNYPEGALMMKSDCVTILRQDEILA